MIKKVFLRTIGLEYTSNMQSLFLVFVSLLNILNNFLLSKNSSYLFDWEHPSLVECFQERSIAAFFAEASTKHDLRRLYAIYHIVMVCFLQILFYTIR